MYRFSILLVSTLLLAGCKSKELQDYLPEKLAEGPTLKQQVSGPALRASLAFDQRATSALDIFKPTKATVGIYHYQGVNIYLLLAEQKSSDHAFGFYRSFSSQPRKMKKLDDGAWAYKRPYVAAYYKNMNVVLFSNPQNYFAYFTRVAEKISAELPAVKKDEGLSYHRLILPPENKFRNSEFYLPSLSFHGVQLTNVYGAQYLIKKNLAHIYVIKDASAGLTQNSFRSIQRAVAKKGYKVKALPSLAAGPHQGIYWFNGRSYEIVYPYRWLLLVMTGFSDIDQAQAQIRNMFREMRNIRHLVKKKN